jgi:hypothetical protein
VLEDVKVNVVYPPEIELSGEQVERGVGDTVAEEPVPTVLIVETLNVYAVPLVKPVTVAEVVVETPSAKVVKFVPSVEY